MKRRDVLGMAGSTVLARWLGGCDRLVVLGSDDVKVLDPITSNEDHYVYSVFGVPDVDPATHQTALLHEDLALGTLDLAFLESLPARDKEHTLQCIGSGPINLAISNAVWSGLPLIEVLDALGIAVPESAVGLRFVGADRNAYSGEQYHAGLPIELLADGPLPGRSPGDSPLWIVWRMNGEPVPLEMRGRVPLELLRAVEALAITKEQGEAWRKSGFGAALIAPGGELLSGASALATTRDAAMRLRWVGAVACGSTALRSVISRVLRNFRGWPRAPRPSAGRSPRWGRRAAGTGPGSRRSRPGPGRPCSARRRRPPRPPRACSGARVHRPDRA